MVGRSATTPLWNTGTHMSFWVAVTGFGLHPASRSRTVWVLVPFEWFMFGNEQLKFHLDWMIEICSIEMKFELFIAEFVDGTYLLKWKEWGWLLSMFC